jgi:hypothetical protein
MKNLRTLRKDVGMCRTFAWVKSPAFFLVLALTHSWGCPKLALMLASRQLSVHIPYQKLEEFPPLFLVVQGGEWCK